MDGGKRPVPGRPPFHQIVTGGVSGSWWAGDLDEHGIPHATQRLGAPRGYYVIDFDGPAYVDTYMTFGGTVEEQMHASFNTPRFRKWAQDLFAYVDLYDIPSEVMPPVTAADLGDMNMLSRDDLEAGTWVSINVWNGSKESRVSVSIDGGPAVEAMRTQPGEGEGRLEGPEYADPLALAGSRPTAGSRSGARAAATRRPVSPRGADTAGGASPAPSRRGC